MSYRSHEILQGPGYANVRALYKADGYAEEELKRPIIGIANAYNSICPGHIVLRQMAERIREGIQAAGGMPIEFGTIGACDGIAMGHEGMRYILPAREMIANDVEAMVQAHRLDGIVLLGSCDKIIPGMLIGAMRVNLPAIFINGGPSLPGHMADGNPYGGEWIDHSCIQQSEGALQAEKITEKEFKWIEDNAMPTVGSCAMLGTANTMGCLAEAMGIMLPGSATIPAVYSKRMAAAYNSGKAIVDLVHKNIRIQDIITKRALANAIMVNSAMGGSTNAVLHLLAIAHSGKINLTIDDFETISSGIQHLVAMIPAGKYTLFDFFEAGGVQALMKEMEEKLYVDALTCTGDRCIDAVAMQYMNFYENVKHAENILELKNAFLIGCQALQEMLRGRETAADSYKLIYSMKQYIKENLDDPDFSLGALAKAYYMNSSYLSRFFKEKVKSSFVEYLTEQRIDKAKQLLQYGNFKIYEVGEKVGIYNANYFGILFKKKVGVTPAEYRKQYEK